MEFLTGSKVSRIKTNVFCFGIFIGLLLVICFINLLEWVNGKGWKK